MSLALHDWMPVIALGVVVFVVVIFAVQQITIRMAIPIKAGHPYRGLAYPSAFDARFSAREWEKTMECIHACNKACYDMKVFEAQDAAEKQEARHKGRVVPKSSVRHPIIVRPDGRRIGVVVSMARLVSEERAAREAPNTTQTIEMPKRRMGSMPAPKEDTVVLSATGEDTVVAVPTVTVNGAIEPVVPSKEEFCAVVATALPDAGAK